MRPVVIAGARPNFVKVAPLLRALRAAGDDPLLVHTGQHYDDAMSASFFRELNIPEPDVNLRIGSGSHAAQTAGVMVAFDEWLDTTEVDAVIVVGDVNSTVACTLVASKRGLPVAHVEAGLRSYDRTMPEEINRLVVDAIADWLLTPSPDADANLLKEGADPGRIHLVGNIMVDSLFDAAGRRPATTAADTAGLGTKGYGLVTLHRPALVDSDEGLRAMAVALAEFSSELPLLFPVHPRTRSRLTALGFTPPPTFHLCSPLSYLDFVSCEAEARLVITDSGGVQEETTCLGVPCLTVRNNTERPITVSEGTNELVGTDPDRVIERARARLAEVTEPRRPALWDGNTAERIVKVLHR